METKKKLACMMCESGLDPNLKDVDGKTAANYAPVNSVMMEYLNQVMATDKNGLMEQGNQMYKDAKYADAIELYRKALTEFDISTTDLEVKNHQRAILHSNLSECYFKLNLFDDALYEAMKSVLLSTRWFKAHMLVGKVFIRLGDINQAIEAFLNSYQMIEDPGYSTKITVLLGLMECIDVITGAHNDSVKSLWIMIRVGDPDAFLELMFHCLKEEKWYYAQLCYGGIKLPPGPSIKHNLDLKAFCNESLQKKPRKKYLLDLLLVAMQHNDQVTSLKFHDGDTYVHAFVNIWLSLFQAVNYEKDLSVFVEFLKTVVRDDINICDEKGNTALHFLAENKNDPEVRYLLAFRLIQHGLNRNVINKQGKRAWDLYQTDDMLKHVLHPDNEMSARSSRGANSSNHARSSSSMNSLDNARSSNSAQSSSSARFSNTARSSNKARSTSRGTSQTRTKLSHNSIPKSKVYQKVCDECVELMEEATQCQNEGKDTKVFLNLVTVINNKKHGSDKRHIDLKKRCLEQLAVNLCLRKDIPPSLLQITSENCHLLISHLAKRDKWNQIYNLVRNFRVLKGVASLKDFARQLSMTKLLSAPSLVRQDEERLKILNYLLKNGGVFNPSESTESVKFAMANNEFKVVLALLEKGVKAVGVTFTDGDTPLHAALHVALERDLGNFALYDALKSCDSSGNKIYKNLDLECCDEKGNNLLHLAAQAPNTEFSVKAVKELCNDRQVLKNQKNKDNKIPCDYLPNIDDPRVEFLGKTSSSSQSSKEERVKGKSSASTIGKTKTTEGLRRKIIQILSKIPDSDYNIFVSLPQEEEEENDERDEESSSDGGEEDSNEDSDVILDADHDLIEGGIDDSHESDNEVDTSVDANAFDNSTWEVECTEQVWNILKTKEKLMSDTKAQSGKKLLRKEQITIDMKRIMVKKIQDLLSGNWHASLTRRVKCEPSSLQLHYIKLPHGGYILWELAVAFSPRCSKILDENDTMSNSSNGRIYSEIIRIWSITFSNLRRTIQKIVTSHNNGKMCIMKKNLKSISNEQSSGTSTLIARIPIQYEEIETTEDINNQEVLTPNTINANNQEVLTPNTINLCTNSQEVLTPNTIDLCPPASTGKTEYHILKFYSFSSSLVAAILTNMTAKVEFPFKVTDKEHALINLQTKRPLLLIGRSGTGKTTVCLYRLWAKYLDYWEQVRIQGFPILRRVLPVQIEDVTEEAKENQDRMEHFETKKDDFDENEEKRQDLQDESEATDYDAERDEDNNAESDVKTSKTENVEYHHLHQVFVTKNPKLCSQVKKSFQRLCRGADYIAHQREEVPDPNTFDDISDNVFPLFLTSHQLLILLDASVEGETFFDRDENLALKADIPGWGTQREIFHTIPLEMDSSDEEGGNAAASGSTHGSHQGGAYALKSKKKGARRRDKPNRRECTYDVFTHQVWPVIKNKEVRCHPSLVWMEIMSFIKGSYEALHNDKGYLDEKQYIEIGLKRAPNFLGDRTEIYKIFKAYNAYRIENLLFDEADLIFNIYQRLTRMDYKPWVFHQIYVDETQDFTQAELCLMIKLSEDPNAMLLTGDTAQTIMRGISFRFEDLKSLFYYYAKETSDWSEKNQCTIEIPKGYRQLRHNYRSHTGILSLASSVLTLLAEFFRDSFDILKPDQGMFHGPPPVIIETCESGDLACLLNGNRRKTSHIEFGAHQAILVMNEEAKRRLPTDLQTGIVLTIYESKGLEFDDILIYNFFKDSKATEEWRVVTSYLNSQKESLSNGRVTTNVPINLDADVLEKPNRPHPLNFDATKHKVLNAELKQLYTAVTRARVNVWIFDEDLDKRAPMFEYFKALKLVTCMQSGVDENPVDTGLFFAVESTCKEWRKKGEMFMSQKSYKLAAKCYEKGQSPEKQRLAEAHILFEKASMKENERASIKDVKLLFLKAGVEFVHCGSFHLAAVCFYKAKENIIAAMAYEKKDEFIDAGRLYKEAKDFVEASRCFKRCGRFHQAIKTLDEGMKYELAIECLQEYDTLMSNLKSQKKNIPSVLTDNKPQSYMSEGYFLEKLIKEYANNKDEEHLKSTIKRFTTAKDQVHYLCEYGYFKDAAHIHKDQGNYDEAVKLLMENDILDTALEYAEISLIKPLRATVHLKIASKAFSNFPLPENEHESERRGILKDEALSHCQKAKTLYKELDDKHKVVQSNLLVGMINQNSDLLRTASKEFQRCSPANTVGSVEAFKEFLNINKSKCLDENDTKLAIDVIESGTSVVKKLEDPSSTRAATHYLKSYQLKTELKNDKEIVIWSANQSPLSVLTERRVSQQEISQHKDKKGIMKKMCQSLKTDLTSWIELAEKSLNGNLPKKQQCPNYQQGNECQTDCCSFSHSSGQSKEEILATADMLLQKIELENIRHQESSGDQWLNIRNLLDFLPPFGHTLNLASIDVIKQVICKIRSNPFVKNLMCRYFNFLWKNTGRIGRGQSKDLLKERAKNSKWFIQSCFYARLFHLALDVEKEAIDMEDDLFSHDKIWMTKVSKYAIFAVKDRQGRLRWVESLGRRFIQSFDLLTGKSGAQDLFESFFPFTKLLGAFGVRGNNKIMPSLEHLLFWMEFYSVLSFCFLSEIYQRNSKHTRHFIMPSSYKTLVDIVSLLKGNGTIEKDVVSYNFQKKLHTPKILFQRQQYIINLLTGCDRYSKMSLINMVGKLCNGDQKNRLVAERIMVLTLVMLFNMQLGYLDEKLKNQIRIPLQNLHSSDGTSLRLKGLIETAANVPHALAVLEALNTFLPLRGEDSLCIAVWNNQNETSPLQLKDYYLPDRVKKNMMIPYPEMTRVSNTEDIDNEVEQDGEVEKYDQAVLEMESLKRNELKLKRQEEQLNKANQIIYRFLRQSLLKVRLKKITFHKYENERDRHFQSLMQKKDNICDVCDCLIHENSEELLAVVSSEPILDENLTPEKIHERSPDHLKQMCAFEDFKRLYTSQIHDKVSSIEDFFLTKKVLEKTEIYEDINIAQLIQEYQTFHDIKNKMITEKIWAFEVVETSFNKLQNTFLISYQQIKDHFQLWSSRID